MRGAIKQWKPILLIYVVTTVLSGVIGLGTMNTITENLGTSGEMNQLVDGFSRTVYVDFQNHYGEGLKSVQGWVKWILLIFLLLSIGLHAGLLHNLKTEQVSIRSFLNGVKRYFLPFLGFTLLFVLIAGFIGAIIYVPYFMILGNPLTDYTTELPFLYSLLGVSIVFIVLLTLITAWSVYTRLAYMETKSFWQSIKLGLKSVFKNPSKVVIWAFMILMISAILFYLFLTLNASNSASSWFWTFLTLTGLQLIAGTKIFLRTIYYKGLQTLK